METEILNENRLGIGTELYFALTAHWLREVATCVAGLRWYLWHIGVHP